MVPYNFDRISVLVVEDNLYIRSILVQCLRALGIGFVNTAQDGAEAIAFMRQVMDDPLSAGVPYVDIILSDWRMSPVDGLMLLRWVRRHEDSPNRFIPFVMTTGYADEERVAEARELGVTEMLAKPFSVASVASRILQLVDRPRQFIHTPDFFGPDRRRRDRPPPGRVERRVLLEEDLEVIYDAGR